MINLAELHSEKEAIVPILDDSFQYNYKKYTIPATEGWYRVLLKGNNALIKEQIFDVSEIEKLYETIKGFTYNNTIVFSNFDTAKRKWGFNTSKELFLNTSVQSFNAVIGVVWEDRRIYCLQPDYSNAKIFELKALFDDDKSITPDSKGITPELRTVFLFHAIERNNIRAVEEEKRLKESVPYRLKTSFERAGATLQNYYLRGKYIEAIWKIPGYHEEFISKIDANTFRVVEAGFCMSGDDARHNITSMVLTAEEYSDRDVIWRTRT